IITAVWTLSPTTVYTFSYDSLATPGMISAVLSQSASFPLADVFNPTLAAAARVQELLVRVPYIRIAGDFDPDTSNPVMVQYTIGDSRSYQNGELARPGCDIVPCKDRMIPANKVIQTIFNKEVDMFHVIRGLGTTYQGKAVNLYNRYNTDLSIDRDLFMGTIVTYGLLKFILAYLLYGKFSTRYLLNKYSEKFFHDLARSRFSCFIQ